MKKFTLTFVFVCILSHLLMSGPVMAADVPKENYDPVSLYKIGLAWDYPPYLMIDIPAAPGDAIFSQGPFPYIAPVLQKSGWITGHSGLYAGRKDHNNDGIDEYVTAESARFGVWYGYFYPMRRFEKGHGKMEDYLKKDTTVVKFLKKTFGENVSESSAVKKYDELLDGTYMGARTVDALSESPKEFEYRRLILEFAHNYVLKNSDYSYDGFKQPLLSLFSSLNTNDTGGYGKGHNEKFTCVGLVEAAYEYAGIDVVPKYIEETNVGLTPLKQFLYTKPASKLFVKKGEKTSFDVWHVIHGKRTFEHAVNCSNVPSGCSFDGKTFNVDSTSMNVGTYEIEFVSADYPDQHQKIKIFVTNNNALPSFDFNDVAKGYAGIEKISPEMKTAVENLGAVKSDSKKESDQKLLSLITSCKTVDDAVFVAKNIKNGAARDIALLYSLGLAQNINDLYKLSMFADSNHTISKILYSPLGYRVQGIENAIQKITSADGLSMFFNMKCGKVLKESLQQNYAFVRTVGASLKVSFDDISKMDVNKIMGFIKYLCANPKELNKLENAYLISLIQKRVYFGISNGEAGAAQIREQVLEISMKQLAAMTPEKNANKSNIIADELIVARFLATLTSSLDVNKKWLDQALAAEKTFMKTLGPAITAIPGAAIASTAVASGAATGPFSKISVTGNISPELKNIIASENADFAATVAGDETSSEMPSVTLEAPDKNGNSNSIVANSGSGAPSEAVKAAYDRYRADYKKYIDALNSGVSDEELAKYSSELANSSDEYQRLSGQKTDLDAENERK